jgi:prolipoprotein diacylglyceryltransferase
LPPTLLSLPSPPSPVMFEGGPFAVRYCGLCVALGIADGTWLTRRELAQGLRRGPEPSPAFIDPDPGSVHQQRKEDINA